MKDLGALIRYKKWMLDEKRRVLAEAELLARNLRNDLAQMALTAEREQQIAGENPEAGYNYAEYLTAIAKRRETIMQSIASLEEQTRAARDEVAAAFEELKRYEITQAQRDKEQKAALAAKEQAALDEVALNTHRRRKG